MKSNQPLQIPSKLDILVMFCRSAGILPFEITLDEVRCDIQRDYIDFVRLHPETIATNKALISVVSAYAINHTSSKSRKAMFFKQIVAEARVARYLRTIN